MEGVLQGNTPIYEQQQETETGKKEGEKNLIKTHAQIAAERKKASRRGINLIIPFFFFSSFF